MFTVPKRTGDTFWVVERNDMETAFGTSRCIYLAQVGSFVFCYDLKDVKSLTDAFMQFTEAAISNRKHAIRIFLASDCYDTDKEADQACIDEQM